MRILAIDSSGLVATVAVVEEENEISKTIAEYTINYKKTHSQTLLPMLDEIVKMERVVRVVDETEPDYQFDLLKQKYDGTLLQKYIEVMEQCPNLELRKKALYYGVQAMLDAAEDGRETKG